MMKIAHISMIHKSTHCFFSHVRAGEQNVVHKLYGSCSFKLLVVQLHGYLFTISQNSLMDAGGSECIIVHNLNIIT